MRIRNTPENIDAFLHFGWLPRLDIKPPFPEEWIPLETTCKNPSLITGANTLRQAVSKQVHNHEVVVPLSGGLDSRAMLAILHEQGRDITAVTLGVPGTHDFEIGKIVARKTGIKHEAINVNEVRLSTEALVSVAKEVGDWTNIIETYWSILIAKKYAPLPIVSGFLGDFLAGSYSKRSRGENWENTTNQFCKDNQVSRIIKLTSQNYQAESSLPSKPSYFSLSNYEELVYRVRHTCSLRPTAFETDFGYVTPFRDEEWVRFILSCSPEFRDGQKFYQEMLLRNWPEFFTLPCKNYKGASIDSSVLRKRILAQKSRIRNKISRTWPQISHSLFGVDRMLNYTDFNNQIVNNQNIRDVILENLSDLEKRNSTPWLNLKEINKHLSKAEKLDYNEGVMLLTLANLEINLKANTD